VTRDEQEAKSIRYGPKTNRVVKLSSGAWALFDYGFRVLSIRPTFAELEPFYTPTTPPPPKTKLIPAPLPDLDLDLDLDLDITI